MRTPVIAIVGRPNVGKSTLFNRILGHRKAIVEDEPGVTRDRNYAFIDRFEIPFTLVDTGGFDPKGTDPLQSFVLQQTEIACQEADLILALFDGQFGCHPTDHDLLAMLRRYRKPVVYVVNKIDGDEHTVKTADFYELGVGDFFDVSALHGRQVKNLVRSFLEALPNFGLLLAETIAQQEHRSLEESSAIQEFRKQSPAEFDDDEAGLGLYDDVAEDAPLPEPIFAPVFVPGQSEETSSDYDREFRLRTLAEIEAIPELSDDDEIEEADDTEEPPPPSIGTIKFAIVGKPNVGKSTLFNLLLRENRAITSPIAGTTRDPLEVKFERDGQEFELVDTAGLRKQARVDAGVERYSTMRALSAISECDVAVLVIDATEGATEQDTRVAGLAHDQGRGLIIAVNKWDLVEKDHRTAHEFKLDLKQTFKFAPYASHLFISAKTGKRCETLLGLAKQVALSRSKRISTNRLNRVLTRELRRVSAPSYRGGPIKVYYASQIDVAPPYFLLVVNYPRGMHFSYLRFIKNIIREKFGFEGTDLKFKLASRRRDE